MPNGVHFVTSTPLSAPCIMSSRFHALGPASDVPIASSVHRQRGDDGLRGHDRAVSDWSTGCGAGVPIAIEIHP